MFKNTNLSVCIIAKNEEKMLFDCLKSIESIAEEIILVDTGSNDNTIEIAKKFNCKIYQHHWENDFAKARNYALNYATKKYVLSIDADERLLNPEIFNDTINNSVENIGGWLINVVSHANRGNGLTDKYSGQLLRLFLNHPEIRFYGEIHEQILENILKLGLKINNSDLKINHLGYNLNPDEMKNKQIRNLNILNSLLDKNPNNAHNLYQRAKTLLALNDISSAEKDISKSIELGDKNTALMPQALNFGGVIALQLNNNKLAKERAEFSLEIVPNQAFANFILAEIYFYDNDFIKALDYYQKMKIAQKSNDIFAQIVGDYNLPEEHLQFKLGKCFMGIKDYSSALNEFRKGLEIKNDDIPNMLGIANVLYFIGEYQKSKEFLEIADKLSPNNQEISNYLKIVKNEIINKSKSLSFNKEKPLISLSMIVKNEEKYLEGCLVSVIDFVDEIVIVDTGSTDKTLEIAKKYNAKIFFLDWENDFAKARNESLKNCSGEWILYLDADERLDKKSTENIREILKSTNDKLGALICTIESEHLQLTGEVENHRGGYPRLFRNYGYPTIKFQGRVHEQISPSIIDLGKELAFSDIIIHHLGYNQTREIMESKIKRNFELLMKHVQEEPLNGYAWFQLGQTLAQMQLFEQAEGAIRFAINTNTLKDSIYASATATLAQLVGSKKNFEEALNLANLSLEKAPNQVFALHLKAFALMYLNQFEESEKCFFEVLNRLEKSKGVPLTGFDVVLPKEIVLKGLNELKEKRGF